MDQILKLQREADGKLKEVEALDKLDNLTEEQTEQRDALQAEADALLDKIFRLQKTAEARKRLGEFDEGAEIRGEGDQIGSDSDDSVTTTSSDSTFTFNFTTTGGEQRSVSFPVVEVGRDREAERPFRSFGDQLRCIYDAAVSPGTTDKRLLSLNDSETRAAQGAQTRIDSDGGFLIQKNFADGILSKTYETGQVVGRMRNVPITNGNSIDFPAVDETSRADGSRYGGIRSYWTGEAGSFTKSKPKFGVIGLKVNKLTGLFYATDELLDDTAALGSYVEMAFPEEFAFKLDDSGVNGDGSGKPLGVLNANCTVSVTKETNQAAATILYENIVKMWARMWARSRANAVWFINQDCEPQLFTMSLAVGTGGAPVYMPPGGASASPYGRLFGRPVIPIEQCATLGTVGDIILADFSQYLHATKGGIRSAQSIHVQFTTEETAFRWSLRVDGQPWWSSALTPYKGSNTQSPFITLATRA